MNRTEIAHHFREKMPNTLIFPDFEIEANAVLAEEIFRYKEINKVKIFAHTYMNGYIYHAPFVDVRGDSLELAAQAQSVSENNIVILGVPFMAGAAAAQNPGKNILIPSLEGGCSLANGITTEQVQAIKDLLPGLPVITYINSTIEVKALTDVCCTSSNAQKVIEWAKSQIASGSVIFLPDGNLAENKAHDLGMNYVRLTPESLTTPINVQDNTIYTWNAVCEVHANFQPSDVLNIRAAYPGVRILAHPETNRKVIELLDPNHDFVGATSQIIKQVEATDKDTPILVMTECATASNVNQNRNIIRQCSYRCPHMNVITMENTLESVKKLQYKIIIPEELRIKSVAPIEKMFSIK